MIWCTTRLPVSGNELHHHDHALRAVDEIHRAAHTLDDLPGDHPVGEVACLANLHCAEHGEIDVTTANHPERKRGVEERGAGKHRHRLFAGVDQVGVFLALERIRAHPKNAVLALQRDPYALRNVVRDQGRQADAEINVLPVAQFLRNAGGELRTRQRHVTAPSCVR